MSRLLSSGWVQAWHAVPLVFILGLDRRPPEPRSFPIPAALARPGGPRLHSLLIPASPVIAAAASWVLQERHCPQPSGFFPSIVRPSYGHTCEVSLL